MTQDEFDAKLDAIMDAMCDRHEQFMVAWDLALLDGCGVVTMDGMGYPTVVDKYVGQK